MLPLVAVRWSFECECAELLLAMLCASETEAASNRDALSVSLRCATDDGGPALAPDRDRSQDLPCVFLALTLSKMLVPE